ncbi:unnamed protein product [Rhizophagus irregularis]|nr:unnamed protein product [Rhizophagus irregularis]
MDQFREGPQVVISFLNYLHNHKVCPEYEEDMQMALQIAHKAKEELPNCKAFAQNAPGKLNKACSLLFGGELYGMLDDPWNGEEMLREFDVSTAEPFFICVNSDLGIYAIPGMRITADFHKLSNGFWYWPIEIKFCIIEF